MVDEIGQFKDVDKAEAKKLTFKAPNKPITALSVVEWVNSHPLFKWSGMCLKIGLDKGNFGKILKSDKPELKKEVLEAVVEVLQQYGF